MKGEYAFVVARRKKETDTETERWYQLNTKRPAVTGDQAHDPLVVSQYYEPLCHGAAILDKKIKIKMNKLMIK